MSMIRLKGKVLVLLLVFLSASSIALTQPVVSGSTTPIVEWSQTYPRQSRTVFNVSVTHLDVGSCFIQTSDGGYLIAGTLEDNVYWAPHGGFADNQSATIIKTDTSGNLQWQKPFYFVQAIYQTKDDGYFILAQGAAILKLDSQGSIVLNKTLDMPLSQMQQTSEDKYILVGSNGNTAIIMSINENGDLLWNKTLYNFPNSFSNTITVSNIAKANDGNYLIVGWSSTFVNAIGKGEPNLWLLKFDSNGNLLFNRGFSYDANAGIDVNPAVIGTVFVASTNDGGCLLAGTASFPFLVKLASNGDWRWNRSYPNGVTVRAALSSAIQTADGGYIAVGAYPNSGVDKTLIIKTDTDGNLNWNQTIASSVPFAAATSIKITNDNGYAVIGSLDGNIWLEKFAAQSNVPSVSPSSSILAFAVVAILLLVIAILTFLLLRRHRKTVS
jgi:photosystem II stability/assembly factor-like uncharacterized protein